MTVWVAEDRSLAVSRAEVVKTAWVNIDKCVLGSRVRMSPEAVEKAYRRLLCLGDDHGSWPPIVGHWDVERFHVDDGRHQFIAAMMLGRTHVFVCWLAARPADG